MDRKLWMVKFYLKEPKLVYKGMKTKRIGILSYDSEPIYETELVEREIKATIVASEDEANILVKGFTDDIALTRAEKIELEDKLNEIEDKEK